MPLIKHPSGILFYLEQGSLKLQLASIFCFLGDPRMNNENNETLVIIFVLYIFLDKMAGKGIKAVAGLGKP